MRPSQIPVPRDHSAAVSRCGPALALAGGLILAGGLVLAVALHRPAFFLLSAVVIETIILAGLYAAHRRRNRAVRDLGETAERWRACFERAPLCGVLLDDCGAILEANEAATTLTGFSRSELLEMEVCDLCAADERSAVRKGFAQLGSVGEWEAEYRIQARDGCERRVQVHGIRVSPSRHLVFFQDVTRRDQMDRVLRSQRNLAMALTRTDDLKETLELCTKGAIEAAGMDAGGVYLLDSASGELRLGCQVGLSEAFVESCSVLTPDSPQAKLIKRGKSLYTEHSQLGVPREDVRIKENLRAVAIVPIYHQDRVIGCLNIGSHTQKTVPPHARLVLESLAGQIGRGIVQEMARHTVREHEENMRTFFESVDDFLFVLDMHGRVQKVNPAVVNRLGYGEAELLGGSFLELHAPEDRAAAQRTLGDLLAGLPDEYRFPLWTRNERRVPVESHIVRGCWNGEQAFFVVSRDISERLRIEDEREAYLAQLTALFESLPYGILVEDAERRIIFANQQLCSLLHIVAPGALIGTEAGGVFSASAGRFKERERFLRETAGLCPPEENSGPHQHELTDGRIVEQACVPISLKSNHGGRLWLYRDVTEAKRAEAMRIKMERRIQQAQKLESLGVLTGGIAHDFNNLLTSILGYAELALDGLESDAPASGHLHQVKIASQRAADLTRQILAYSGRASFVTKPLDLSELVREMLGLLRSSISKKVELELRLPEDLPLIDGDGTQVRQVVMNLVINAAEAIEDEDGRITVAAERLTCRPGQLNGRRLFGEVPEGDCVRLTVADTGCGMTAGTMECLFDPFFTTKFTGRGLGMSAVLGIIRGHHGAIEVESRVNEGTTFRIFLPVSRSRPECCEGPVKDKPRRGYLQGTVLLVDDEPTVRTLGRAMIERLGPKVLTAADGREAIRIYQEAAVPVDLVLLDLTMPVMDGPKTLAALKQVDPEVRVVIVSGAGTEDLLERFENSHVQAVIQKPYTLEALEVVLSDCLSMRESVRE